MFGWFKKKPEDILEALPEYRVYQTPLTVGDTGIKVVMNKHDHSIDHLDLSNVLVPNRDADIIQNMSVGFDKNGKCIRRREFFVKEGIVKMFNEEDANRTKNRNSDQVGVICSCPVTKMLMVMWHEQNVWSFLNKKMCDAFNNFIADAALLEIKEPIIIDNTEDDGW